MTRSKRSIRSHSLIFSYTLWYILNLFLIMIIIGGTVLLTASYFLFNNVKHNTASLQQSLKEASQEDQVDWSEAIDNVLYPDFGYFYVKVTNASGKTIAASDGWDQIIDAKHSKVKKNWLKPVLFDQREGLYYTSSTTWKQSNGKLGKIIVIAELNHIQNFILLLIKVLLISTLIGGILGSILIYVVTKRNIKPLKQMTNTVREINDFSDFKKRVTIPEGPYELTQLAEAFNSLFIKIEGQFEKERAFVSNASHELRTPITAFKGHINLLKRWGKRDPEVLDQSIRTLETESNRMQRLITQLLILASTDSPYIKRQTMNLSTILNEVKHEMTSDPAHHHQIQSHIFPDIKIFGNADQIKQVAIILVENAIKYTNVEGQISISVYQEEDWGVFEVKDTGIGVSHEETPFIFERFYRVDKARSRKTGGSGLGLSIAKAIVTNHKGSITVKSELGAGSTFTVKLPINDEGPVNA